MNRMQKQVEEFHRAFDHPIGTTPAIQRPELRIQLILEEAGETVEAIRRGDLVEAADGLCDLLYVTLGAAIEFGLDIEPIFNEVHRSNMAKKGGKTSPEGKQLKPEGWTPPDVEGEINRQRMRLCFKCDQPAFALYDGTPKCVVHNLDRVEDLPASRK